MTPCHSSLIEGAVGMGLTQKLYDDFNKSQLWLGLNLESRTRNYSEELINNSKIIDIRSFM